MAWTISNLVDVTSKRVRLIHAIADAATYNIDTGLSWVEHVTWSHKSIGTVTGKTVAYNSHCSGTSAPGYLGCSGFASGDDLFFTVYGH